MTAEEIVVRLRAYFEEREEVVVAYLFGSVARGRAGKLSDIDVAILVDESLIRPVRYGYRADILTDLMGRLHTNKVDLVVLNKVSPLLAHEAVRNGELIFCRNSERRVAFETDAFRRYVDTEPLRRIQGQYLDRRIAEGKFGLGSLEAKATEAASLGMNDDA